MERFNIEDFTAHQVDDEYTRTLQDGTIITEQKFDGGFTEKTIPKKGWFYSYKEFFPNGKLRMAGSLFKKGDYKTGTWVEYDEAGKLEEQANTDKPFKQTLDSIFKIIEKKQVKFTLEDPYCKITRRANNKETVWVVEYRIRQDRIELLFIDDASGKIIKEAGRPFQGDH